MELLRTQKDLATLQRWRRDGLVLVPTMGALHAGHLSLLDLAAGYGPVVVSIFVNPNQFGEGEDYERYPQDLTSDLQALAAHEVVAVFAPNVGEMYSGQNGVTVQPGTRADSLCGAQRPGHFSGVLTVVAKLFNLVRPAVAIFGRKDAQQCLVIQEMVTDLKFPVRLIDGPTVREEGGLAMSSRNRYLSASERERALCIWSGLQRGRHVIENGERDADAIMHAMTEELSPADSIDYVELRSVPDLLADRRVAGKVLLAIAAQVGPARLIDNLVLNVTADSIIETSLWED